MRWSSSLGHHGTSQWGAPPQGTASYSIHALLTQLGVVDGPPSFIHL